MRPADEGHGHQHNRNRAETARAAGDLLEATDPRSLVHELHGLALAANQARQVLGDDDAPARSCALMLDVLERHAR